jgi:hypothetical protein
VANICKYWLIVVNSGEYWLIYAYIDWLQVASSGKLWLIFVNIGTSGQ